MFKELLIAVFIISCLPVYGNELEYETEDESSFEELDLNDPEIGVQDADEYNRQIIEGHQAKELANSEINEKVLRRSCMIVSDLLSIGASAFYCTYYPINSVPISRAGSALFACNFALDHLLDLSNQISEVWEEEDTNLSKIMFTLAQCAEAASISGFACLTFSDHLKVGSWLVAAGLSVRMLTGGYRIATQGYKKVYGDDNALLNCVLRMGLENGGGTAGSYVLGIGACLGDSSLDYIGSLVIGTTVGTGSFGVLGDNIYQLWQLN
ncbi:MAG: hypothetical protein AB8G05_26565 [Oligoflexales bacterium]